MPLIESSGAGRKGGESFDRVNEISDVVAGAAEVFAAQLQSQFSSEARCCTQNLFIGSGWRSIAVVAQDCAGKLGVMGPGATVEVA